MRSEEARQIFKRRQLLEVICQLRFPDILKIESTDPAEFQDRIRGEYPKKKKKVEQHIKFGLKTKNQLKQN